MVCRTCLALVVYFFLTLPVNADLLINGSFEEPGFGGGFYRYLIDGDTSIAHWTVRDDGIGEMPYWYNFGSPGSPYTNGFDGFYAVSLNIGSSTETATSLVSSTTYRLSFWASHATNDPLAVFAPLEVTVGGLTKTFAQPLGLQSFMFTANSTDANALLRFANNATGSDHKIYSLDAVSLTAVPEPASAVTILGALGLLALHRCRVRLTGLASA